MNNKIKLAVAGAVLSAASVANAGIIIPAGDWTLDIGGNVNAYYTMQDADRAGTTALTNFGIVTSSSGADGVQDTDSVAISTGLLPNYLSVSGTTRQNDVDVSFTISIQPGTATNSSLLQNTSDAGGRFQENRQAFMTFGDKSWGTVKLGKDLGVFGSNAILSDMTLLGVGGTSTAAGRINTTTTGGIGFGYIYADWIGQASYTTPNMNGFQATLAVVQPWELQGDADAGGAQTIARNSHDKPGFEGQVTYSWSGDVAGKVWAEYAYQDINDITASGAALGNRAQDEAVDIWGLGANVTVGNLNLVGYWYDSDGYGSAGKLHSGLAAVNNQLKKRDGDGGYVQATYVIPTGTKLGVAYGRSSLDEASGETFDALVEDNERWTVGAYHPLTKHLNLVAEYSDTESNAQRNTAAIKDYDAQAFSLGAILFF
jgi:predicted porin